MKARIKSVIVEQSGAVSSSNAVKIANYAEDELGG